MAAPPQIQWRADGVDKVYTPGDDYLLAGSDCNAMSDEQCVTQREVIYHCSIIGVLKGNITK
jgi:hypothetical protein